MIPRTLFSEEHEQFRDSVRRFIEREIVPYHEQWEEQGMVDRELWRKAGAAGLLGLYHLIAHVRGKHILGTTSLLNWLGRRVLAMFLRQADVEGFEIDKEVDFVGGRVRRKGSVRSSGSENFALH